MLDSQMDIDLSWDDVFDTVEIEIAEQDEAKAASDALIKSILNKGYVDMEYISKCAGIKIERLPELFKGKIYFNPEKYDVHGLINSRANFYACWETAEEYLSGNLYSKLKAIDKLCNEFINNRSFWYNGNKEWEYIKSKLLLDNRIAIEKILPETIRFEDIYLTLGSPWIPEDYIQDFVKEELDSECVVEFDSLTGEWQLDRGTWRRRAMTYATGRLSCRDILKATLNMQVVVVKDEKKTVDGNKRIINEQETILGTEKQEALIELFKKWISRHPYREASLLEIFAQKYGYIVPRKYDGSILEFPGMTDDLELYPYQKNAVARIILSPNTLLAHDVGSGKTFIMIAAAMELKRMGVSEQNLFVVPNNVFSQWKDMFYQMYPQVNLLAVDTKMFRPANRQEVLREIRDNKYDAVLMTYSSFEMIPLSNKALIDELKLELKEVEDLIEELDDRQGNSYAWYGQGKKKNHRALNTKYKALKRKIAELSVAEEKYDGIFFDDLNINRLFIDEAHNFKNVPINTKIDRVKGINTTGSKRCQDMMNKVHYVQRNNCGKGVVFATGTPITNSITDAYIMQKYLQSGELAVLDIRNFDNWIGMFAERKTEFEVDVDTNSYRLATRFSKFHNLPELTNLLANIADFHQVDESNDIPIFEGYTDSKISQSEELKEYLESISHRAEVIRSYGVSRREDNMLKLTTDGRKAALDIRLVNSEAEYNPDSKVNICAKNIYEIYQRGVRDKTTQLVFCDTSAPKEAFNIYDELERILVGMGVDASQIAFIHDAGTEKQRQILFDDMRSGHIRILLGSTFKLGMGVNVQDRLIAVHHLDVPWRPADMVQREGRILRQGNMNDKVQIFRYVTEGSFDAYSWQLLETKQHFINELLSGSLKKRSGGDISETVLDYAEIKALAIGNPLVKKRVEAANTLSHYRILQRKNDERRAELEKELELTGFARDSEQKTVKSMQADIEIIEAEKQAILDDEQDFEDRLSKAENDEDREILKLEKKYIEKLKAEELAYVRSKLFEEIGKGVDSKEERLAVVYRGFYIKLPTDMDGKIPYVYVQRNGRYKLSIGTSENGQIKRVDNLINALPKKLEERIEILQQLENKCADIEVAISGCKNYKNQIDEYRDLVAQLDRELGVKWDE